MRLSTRIVASATIALIVTSWTASAEAQTERPLSVSFSVGTQTALSGDAHGGAAGQVLGLPTSVTAKSYGDVFGAGFYWTAGLGYRVTPNGEIRVSGSYTANPSEQLQVGTVANLPLQAKFDDYKAFGMDFGYRQYLGSGALQPYVGAGAGFTWVDTINSTLSVPAAGVTLSDVGFYESSTVPSVGFSAGAQMRLSEAVAIHGGIDVRWHGALKQNEALAGTGLDTINDDSARWALPITGGLTFRF